MIGILMGPGYLDHKVLKKPWVITVANLAILRASEKETTPRNGSSNRAAITRIQTINLGLDLHPDPILDACILDGQSPQPALSCRLRPANSRPGKHRMLEPERSTTCISARLPPRFSKLQIQA